MTDRTEYPLAEKLVISPDQLSKLIRELSEQKYTVYGPTVRNDAVTYEPITSADRILGRVGAG